MEQNGWEVHHTCEQQNSPNIRGDNVINPANPGGQSTSLSNSPLSVVIDPLTNFHAVFVKGPGPASELLWKGRLTERGAWSDWNSLGTPTPDGLASNPSSIQNSDGLMQIFVISSGNVYSVVQQLNKTSFGQWFKISSLNMLCSQNSQNMNKNKIVITNNDNTEGIDCTGKVLSGDPVSVRSHDGRVYLFVVVDGVAYVSHETSPSSTSSWTSWTVFAGTRKMKSALTVALNTFTTYLEAFAVLDDDEIYQSWQTGSDSWHEWRKLWSLGQPKTNSNPVVHTMTGSMFNGMLELFIRGTNNKIWHTWQTTCDSVKNPWSQCTWGAYYAIGENTPADQSQYILPAVASNIHGGVEVFVTGNDGALWHIWQTKMWGSWSNWESLGKPPSGPLTSAPTIVNTPTGWWNAFGRGVNGELEIYVQEKTFTAKPTTSISGQPITVSWSVPNDEASNTDWVGVFLPNASNSQFLDFLYVNGKQDPTRNPVPSGSVVFKTVLPPGIYEFRYLVNKSQKDVMTTVIKVSKSNSTLNPTEQLFLGMTIGLGIKAFNFDKCIANFNTTYMTFKDAFDAFADKKVYKGLNDLGLGIMDFADSLKICSQTDIIQAIVKFAKDLTSCVEGNCAPFVIDIINEILVIAYEHTHEIFGDIQAAHNDFNANAYEEAGINIGKVIQAVITRPE